MLSSPDSSHSPEKPAKKYPPLKPKEISGFDEAAGQKRMMGNGDERGNAVGVGAIVLKMGEEKALQLTPNSSEDYEVMSKGVLDIKQLIKLTQEGKLPPPLLISAVDMKQGKEGEEGFVEQAARNHNAAKIIDYLQHGGDANRLPREGGLIPTASEIQAYLKKQNSESVRQKVLGFFRRKPVA